MIKGIFLGVSLSVFLASIGLMIAGFTGNIQENYITGAVVGANTITSYATVTGILAFFLCLVFLFLILRNKKH